MEPAKQTFFLSIDIESEGDEFHHPVIAIGAVFGPADGSWPRDRLIRFRGNLMPLPEQKPDPECMRNFWVKNQEVYREIKDAHRPAADVMNEFLGFCQSLVKRFEQDPLVDGKIVLITDCPDFDLGRLHVLGCIQTQTWPSGIRCLGGNKRHGQKDPSERLDALQQWDECENWIQETHPGVGHDHRPDNDAEHSYYQMVYLNNLSSQSVSFV